jgi:hypothetical protein
LEGGAIKTVFMEMRSQFVNQMKFVQDTDSINKPQPKIHSVTQTVDPTSLILKSTGILKIVLF